LALTGAGILTLPSPFETKELKMNIGELKQNGNGYFMGSIETLAVTMTLALREVHIPNKSIRYEIHAKSASGAWVKVGALFARDARETGEEFLQGYIDDPMLEKKLYIACFKQRDGNYAIAWSRPSKATNQLPGAVSQGDDQDEFPFGGAPEGKAKRGKKSADLGASTSDAHEVAGVTV
jgi:uncharacterized protein (DUF736 family)